MSRKSTNQIGYKDIILVIFALAIAYVFITNSTLILVGGAITTVVLIIIIIVGAYYVLPAIGITALTGFITALATLIGITKRR